MAVTWSGQDNVNWYLDGKEIASETKVASGEQYTSLADGILVLGQVAHFLTLYS